ncbi:pyruvate formate lyase activating enzyme [Geobacter argillaceus]|uniref:Pyruvate formate lyase activating enzyme n=2 Tax=Geobacter argillaceus TaxID=345631 RepID=A0A562VL11_9BACT|nr:glycyl-radical enzyme activating protein [Geobacter argillaceus]TWJ18653.1 pyruvate formate lyase activating enzyme [Geobacter argillaceus]
MITPLITEIQRFSLQDGPGIRTTIFVKGCPLHCPWCHNPENINMKREFYFHANKCTACGKCSHNCQSSNYRHSQTMNQSEPVSNDRSECTLCLECVSSCRFGAREAVGKSIDMSSIIEEAVSDRMFYANSGGGVTISGGEPLMYPAFTLELARILNTRENINVAIETCLSAKWDSIVPLLECVDLFIVDIKSLDPAKYTHVIGGSLRRVLANLERLIHSGAAVRIHLPIIPGFNDSLYDFESYAKYLGRFAGHLTGVDLLPYHSYATGKYAQLGRRYSYLGIPDLPSRQLIPLTNALRQRGIREVTIGGMVGTISQTDTLNIDEISKPVREILPHPASLLRRKGVIATRR